MPRRSLRLCGESAAHVYIYRRAAENAEITQRGSFIIVMKEPTLTIKIELVVECLEADA
jgi:hypothetical protein